MSKIKTPVFIVGIIFACIVSAVGTYFGLVAGGVIETTKQEITVTVLADTYEYDGMEHTASSYELSGTFINEKHYASVIFTGGGTNAGNHIASAEVDILDDTGNKVTNKYSITVIPSSITIVPRGITVALDPAQKEYDGTPLTTKSFKLKDSSLAAGHTLVPNYTTSVTEVPKGEEKVYGTMIAEIFDSAGINVTSNYVIDYDTTDGELIITKKPVVITTLSLSKEFDGKALDPNDYLDSATVSGLIPSHDISYEFDTTNISKLVGSSFSLINSASVVILDGEKDVSHNYEIILREIGVLKITPCAVDDDAKLDPLTFKGVNQDIEILLEDLLPQDKVNTFSELGYTVSVKSGQYFSLTDVGSYEYNVKYQILDSSGNDMTSNFTNSSVDVIININPLDVYVITPDVSYEYTGKPYNYSSDVDVSNIVGLQYVENGTDKNLLTLIDRLGYQLKVTAPDYIEPNPENKPYANTVGLSFNKGIQDKTSNFNLIYEDGRIGDLTITKRSVLVSPVAVEKEYTATAVTATDATIVKVDSEGEIVENASALAFGHTYTCTIDGECIDAGQSTTAITSIIIIDREGYDVTNCYDIKYKTSTIKVNKRDVTIHGLSETFTYDGNEYYSTEQKIGNIAGADNLIGGMEVEAIYSSDSHVSLSNTTSRNIISSAKIYADGIELNPNNFNFTYTPGEIKLAYGTIQYTIKQELTFSHYNLTPELNVEFSDPLLNGNYNIVASKSDQIVNVGTYKNINLAFEFTTSEAQQIASFVTFECSKDSLVVVNPYDVYIRFDEIAEVFNGQEVTMKETFIDHNGDGVPSSLLGGDSFIFQSDRTLNPAELVLSVDATLLNYYIVDNFGNDATSNYKVIIEGRGNQDQFVQTLSYIPKEISFVGDNYETVYSGKDLGALELNENNYSISPIGQLPNGYYAVAYDITIDDSDLESNPVINYEVAIYGIYNGQKVDATDYFDIFDPQPGEVRITPLNISVTTSSTSVYYSGDYVKHEELYLSISSDIVTDFDFYFYYEDDYGHGPDCGTYTNVVIYDGEVPEKYLNITYVFGTVTIMPIPVVVTTEPIVVTYGYDPSSITLTDYYEATDSDFLEYLNLDYDLSNYTDCGTYELDFTCDEEAQKIYSTVLPTVKLIINKGKVDFTTTPIVLEYGEEFDGNLADYITPSIDGLSIEYSCEFNEVEPGIYSDNKVEVVVDSYDLDCYDFEEINITFIINKKKMNASVEPIEVEYLETDIIDEYVIESKFAIDPDDSDFMEYVSFGSIDLTGLGAGTYTFDDVIQIDEEANEIYEYNKPVVVVTILKRNISISVNPIEVEFGTEIINSDTIEDNIRLNPDDFNFMEYVSINDIYFEDENVGSYSFDGYIEISNEADNYYSYNMPVIPVTITKKNVEISIKPITVEYKEKDVIDSSNIIIESKDTEFVSYLEVNEIDIMDYEVGSYSFDVLDDSALECKNYSYTLPKAVVTVTKKNVEISIKPITVEYKEKDVIDSSSIIIESKDTEFVSYLEVNEIDIMDYEVGSYSFDVLDDSASECKNYSYTLPKAVVTVTKKNVEISIKPITVEYKEKDVIDSSNIIIESKDTEFVRYLEVNEIDIMDYEVGSYSFDVLDDSASECKNYSYTLPKAVVTVTKKNVEISIKPITVEYKEKDVIDSSELTITSTDNDFLGLLEISDIDLYDYDAGVYGFDILFDNDVLCENYSYTLPKVFVTINKKVLSFTFNTIEVEYLSTNIISANEIANKISDTSCLNYVDIDSIDIYGLGAGVYYFDDLITLLDDVNFECEFPSVCVIINKKSLEVEADDITMTLAEYQEFGIKQLDLFVRHDSSESLSFTVNIPSNLEIGTYVLPILLDEEFVMNYNYNPVTVTITITA